MLTAKADDRKRLVVPQAKPGQVYAILDNPDGTITLSPMQPKERKEPFPPGSLVKEVNQMNQEWAATAKKMPLPPLPDDY